MPSMSLCFLFFRLLVLSASSLSYYAVVYYTVFNLGVTNLNSISHSITPPSPPFLITYSHTHIYTARTYDIAITVCTEGLSINKESKKLMVEFHLRRARVHKLIAKGHISKAAAASSSSSSSSSGENRMELN